MTTLDRTALTVRIVDDDGQVVGTRNDQGQRTEARPQLREGQDIVKGQGVS